MPVRQREKRVINYHVVRSHDVDIHGAVKIISFFISVRMSVEAIFNIMDVIQHLIGSLVGNYHDGNIHEIISRVVAPGFRLYYFRDLEISVFFLERPKGPADIQLAVA